MTDEELHKLVFEAIGEASMCWDEAPTGIFDSTRAKAIGDLFVAALRALRSPAPGSAAMREALESYDYWIDNAVTGSDRDALREASDTLADFVRRALPAPEVPEAVKAWCDLHDETDAAGRILLRWEYDLRDHFRKEYGL